MDTTNKRGFAANPKSGLESSGQNYGEFWATFIDNVLVVSLP